MCPPVRLSGPRGGRNLVPPTRRGLLWAGELPPARSKRARGLMVGIPLPAATPPRSRHQLPPLLLHPGPEKGPAPEDQLLQDLQGLPPDPEDPAWRVSDRAGWAAGQGRWARSLGGARICGSPACLKRLASLCCSPKSSDRTVKNAYGCGAVIQYKVRAVPGRPECGGVARAVDRLPAARKLHPPPTQPGTARTLYCITARVHSHTLTQHTAASLHPHSSPTGPSWLPTRRASTRWPSTLPSCSPTRSPCLPACCATSSAERVACQQLKRMAPVHPVLHSGLR